MALVRLPRKPDYQFIPFIVPSGPDSHVEIWQKYLPNKILAKSAAF
jgi:hypothetical protein